MQVLVETAEVRVDCKILHLCLSRICSQNVAKLDWTTVFTKPSVVVQRGRLAAEQLLHQCTQPNTYSSDLPPLSGTVFGLRPSFTRSGLVPA